LTQAEKGEKLGPTGRQLGGNVGIQWIPVNVLATTICMHAKSNKSIPKDRGFIQSFSKLGNAKEVVVVDVKTKDARIRVSIRDNRDIHGTLT
jgi:hypothetical protein